jgi:Putative  PD-(D/E)XK family member, (DUF4420)
VPDVESLELQFRRVARPTGGIDRLSGTRIPWRPADFIARNLNDEPLLLIAGDALSGHPAIQLRHLRVDFGARCRISEQGGTEAEGDFVVITGQDLTPELLTLFLRVMDSLLRTLPDRPHLPEVREAVHHIAELFRALEVPARRNAQGFWAELFVILASGNTTHWLRAWRSTAREKFDFAFDTVRVDVKSGQSSRRLHSFSLEQLVPPEGSTAYVASVLVRQSASGVGILGLTDRLANEVAEHGELVDKIWRNAAETLGRDFSELMDLRFDEAHAQQTLRFIPAALIPRPHQIDLGVTNVRFDSDIDAVAVASGVRRVPELRDL